MKRSEINQLLREAAAFVDSLHFHLPPFAKWTPDDWEKNQARAAEIADVRLGWDITDFGFDDFANRGLVLFTIRNGKLDDPAYPKTYAEKILIVQPAQLTLTHCHWRKTEDIINRGGATLVVELYGSDDAGGFAEDRGGRVRCDGIALDYAPGQKLKLAPGESVTLRPGDWHAFWGDGGDVLIGEVSTVNDDETDNIFREPIGRFSTIEEDEAPTHLLVSDYGEQLG